MQTTDKNGVICDFCHNTSRQDFTYYSLDVRKVKQFNGRRPSLSDILSSLIDVSFDICTNCFDSISAKVVQTYSKNMNNKTGILKHFCELSSNNLQTSDVYYYCVFTKVIVKTTNCPIICVKCGKLGIKDKTCKCGSNNYTSQAIVHSSPRELEINISNAIYNEWRNIASNISQNSTWSSTS